MGEYPTFNGSIGQDNTTSGTLSGEGYNKSFQVTTAPPLTKITCDTQANQKKFAYAKTGEKFVIVCPKNCTKRVKNLFGTETYTDNSPICIAAIHHGVINDQGGEIKIEIKVGLDSYKGSNGFGIHSRNFGPHIRAFQFLGEKAAVHFSYIEKFTGSINDHWYHVKGISAKNKNNDTWSFYSNNNMPTKRGGTEDLKSIRHLGNISLRSEFLYASWIVFKNAEWANSTVKFNLLFHNKGTVAFFFRYKDRNNFYSLEISPDNSVNNIKLNKKIEGNRLLCKKFFQVRILTSDQLIKSLS